MLFNSYIFIFLFLPICIAGYFGLNHFGRYRLAMAFLLGMSLWFYGYNNVYYLLVILGSIALNYICHMTIARQNSAGNKTLAKTVMIGGVAANLAILFYFKYMDFFIENVNAIFKSDYNLLHIALPLGISFFTFQQISFVVDTYKGEIENVNVLDYACFVSYFPQLIAGPIVSHDEILPQFADKAKKKLNMDNLASGFYMFSLGLAKKVLLANRFSSAVTYGYTTVNRLNTTSALIVMLAYTMQIYFDFSGYCDMAIGIGRMMNIDIPVNFNSPYKAYNIAGFWDRWHITLTRFFTKYIYIPLGGSRRGAVRTYVNILIVFLASGFWHGADWKFVIWGMMHGVLMVIYRLGRKVFDKIPKAINWLFTFLFVNVAWVFFRAPSLKDAMTLLKNITAFRFSGFDMTISDTFRITELKKIVSMLHIESVFPCFIMCGFFATALYFSIIGKNARERMERVKYNLLTALTTVFLLVWSICSLSGLQEFLYFNF